MRLAAGSYPAGVFPVKDSAVEYQGCPRWSAAGLYLAGVFPVKDSVVEFQGCSR